MVKRDPDASAHRSRLTAERVVVGALLLAAIGGIIYALVALRALPPRPPSDPTRIGPERTLVLSRIEFVRDGLAIEAATNLPDGARVDIELATTEVVLALVARCEGGKLMVDSRPTGKATNGSYRVLARFLIEEQSAAVRDLLHYQPRRLDASCPLVVSTGIDPNVELRPRLKKLIGAANNAKGSADLAPITKDAEALDRELWLSTLTPGVRRLRRALEAATRASAFDMATLRRDLIEADVLAGPGSP